MVLERRWQVTGYGIMSVAAGEAHLLNLCVDRHAQRQGYGRRLLEPCCQGRDAGADRVFLEVRPSNTIALAAVPAVGFEQIGIRPAYYQASAAGRTRYPRRPLHPLALTR